MSDTADGLRRSEKYSRFFVGRRVAVRVQAMEEVDGRTRGRDFSDAKWQFRLRAYIEPKATGQVFVFDLPMDKVLGTEDPGDTGKAQVLVEFAAADVGERYLEVVVIDTTVIDETRASGKAEYEVDAPWLVTVYLAPGKA